MIRVAALRACRALSAETCSRRAATATDAAARSSVARCLARPLATSSKPTEEQDVRWRFPADDRTQAMEANVRHGMAQGIVLTLNSKAPLTPDLMEEALGHLQDKVASLRLCLRKRQGQQWLVEVPGRKLDYQVVSGTTDLEEQTAAILTSPIDLHAGPPWKAWLMPCPADAPCAVPEVKVAFPHQCHLLLSVHHALNDGVMVLVATELLLNIIDSLLERATVDTRPLGELRDGVEVREEEARVRAELLTDSKRLLEALRQHSASKRLPVLVEAYGLPTQVKPRTESLPPVFLDAQLVDKVAAKCHAVGATLNACFTAILNISMMEVAREAGLERDVYNITTQHPVDCRRLMGHVKSLPLGYHSLPITQCTATPRHASTHFWQYLQQLDAALRHKLRSNYMCEQRVLEALLRPEGFTHEDMFARRPLPNCDGFFSFVYPPGAATQQDASKNVRVTWSANYQNIHSMNIAVGQCLVAFRGQLRLQMNYSTAAVSERVASRCLEKSLATLHHLYATLD